jgi:hypothetical protein
MLEVAPAIEKHVTPFKLNPKWMKMEDFVGENKAIWKPFNGNLRDSSTSIPTNFKRGKKSSF